MSFTFSWDPTLVNDSNFAQIKAAIDAALARGPAPAGVAGPVVLERLYLGDTPPSIHIQAVEDVASDRVKAVFAMQYAGNASIALRTLVQANLLRGVLLDEDGQQDVHPQSLKPGVEPHAADNDPTNGSCSSSCYFNWPPPLRPSLTLALPHALGALAPLALPLEFTIHDLRLSGTVSLVATKNKGIVMVFDGDPLQSLELSSSLDDLPSVSAQLKREVEIEIREVLRDTIPQVVYQITSNTAAPSPPSTKNEIPIPSIADPKHAPPPIFDFPFLATSALTKIKSLAQSTATLAALSSPSPIINKKSIRPDRLFLSVPQPPPPDSPSNTITATNTPPLIIDFDALSDTDSDVSASLTALLPPPSQPVSPRPHARRVINLRHVLRPPPSSAPTVIPRPSSKPLAISSRSLSPPRPHIDQFRMAPHNPAMVSPANRPKRGSDPRRVVSGNISTGRLDSGGAMASKTQGQGDPAPLSNSTRYFLTQQR